jgi:protein-disulfide isomerase
MRGEPMAKAATSNRLRMTIVGFGMIFILACTGVTGGESEPAAPEPPDDPTVARVGEHELRMSELDNWLKEDWFDAETSDPFKGFELRAQGILGLIDDYLVENAAEQAGLSFDAYLDREVEALGPVSDEEIDLFYAQNKENIQPKEDLEVLRPRIRRFLERNRTAKVVGNLRSETEIQVLLSPSRQKIPEGGVSRGPADAAVTLVEFSDYECPFCGKVEPTLDKLARLYPDDLRIVYRHFPLPSHPNALGAARAAVCAEAQGKFWEYHGVLFENQQALSAADLNEYAEQVGLEMPTFALCLEDEATAQAVMRDIEVGRRAGATATPTFYINGIQLRGAQELQAFQKLVEAERKQSAGR